MRKHDANHPDGRSVPRTTTIGDNIEATLDGNLLTLVIDTSVKGTPSASGKSLVIASTRGNVNVGTVTVGLNIYRKRATG